MKRLLAIVLALGLLLSSSALALNYKYRFDNEATFETLEETRISGPAFFQENMGSAYASQECLDQYPEGTTFVYRSAHMYGITAAQRMNTTLLVYTDEKFETKDAAYAYLKELGVIDLIDEATGSVVLVTPINANGYGAADQQAYYNLQTAMYRMNAFSSVGDAAYYGGFAYRYMIGIGGGATFINNYVAGTMDYIGRVAGLLLIGGDMDRIRNVATYVPVYMVNPKAAVVEKYEAANGVDTYSRQKGISVNFNHEFPLRTVIVRNSDEIDYAECIRDAYYDLFLKAMRIPVVTQGLTSASTPYQGYNFDEAPYSLCNRNALINGVTNDGIYLVQHVEDRFQDIATANGEYIQTWFEFLPESVINGTAPKASVPLWLANHGGGDDPVQFVDEIGLLDLAGEHQFAIVAQHYQSVYGDSATLCKSLAALVKYMLDEYPALDPSRVYVTGYSLGGDTTCHAIAEAPELFAAAIPMAASGYIFGVGFINYEANEEQLAKMVDVPTMFVTSTYDLPHLFDATEDHMGPNYQHIINLSLGYNGMAPIEYDFDAYPVSGFEGDLYIERVLNDEYINHRWFLFNEDDVPMVGFCYTEGLIHALYPEYGKLAYEFAKHYSRNPETFEIIYNPYVD